MADFEDTSYVYHDLDDDSAAINKLKDMTNEELMDNSTIPGWRARRSRSL